MKRFVSSVAQVMDKGIEVKFSPIGTTLTNPDGRVMSAKQKSERRIYTPRVFRICSARFALSLPSTFRVTFCPAFSLWYAPATSMLVRCSQLGKFYLYVFTD